MNTQNSILFQWSSSINSKRIYTAKKQLYSNHHKPLNQTVPSTMRK